MSPDDRARLNQVLLVAAPILMAAPCSLAQDALGPARPVVYNTGVYNSPFYNAPVGPPVGSTPLDQLIYYYNSPFYNAPTEPPSTALDVLLYNSPFYNAPWEEPEGPYIVLKTGLVVLPDMTQKTRCTAGSASQLRSPELGYDIGSR